MTSDAGIFESIAAFFATWRGWFIAAWIAVQVAAPCAYYCGRKDPHDERFAWRMFSPMRMVKCDPRFTLDGQPVDLGSRFHEAWIEVAKRGRFAVVEEMGARLCKSHDGAKVEVDLVCRALDGSVEEWGRGYDLCQVREL